jgi:hypothetical protein
MNDEIIHAAAETAPDAAGDAPAATPEGWPADLPEPPAGPTPLDAPGFEPAESLSAYRMPAFDDPMDRDEFAGDVAIRGLMHEFALPVEVGSSLAEHVARLPLATLTTDALSDDQFRLAWDSTRSQLRRMWGEDTFKARHAALVALVEDVDRRTNGAATDLLDALPGVLLDPQAYSQLALHAQRWQQSQPKARQK